MLLVIEASRKWMESFLSSQLPRPKGSASDAVIALLLNTLKWSLKAVVLDAWWRLVRSDVPISDHSDPRWSSSQGSRLSLKMMGPIPFSVGQLLHLAVPMLSMNPLIKKKAEN